jgi:hypothetical protein
MSTPPWGLLAENHIYQLVVRENERPDRQERDIERKFGITDKIWGIMEGSWQKDPALRPTFTQIVELCQHLDEEVVMVRPISPSNSVIG